MCPLINIDDFQRSVFSVVPGITLFLGYFSVVPCVTLFLSYFSVVPGVTLFLSYFSIVPGVTLFLSYFMLMLILVQATPPSAYTLPLLGK